MSDSPKPPLLAVQVASQPLTLDELKTVLTPSPKPPTPAEIEAARERHERNEAHHKTGASLQGAYAWSVYTAYSSHKDVALLLRAYDAMAAERQSAHDEIMRLIVETNRLRLEAAERASTPAPAEWRPMSELKTDVAPFITAVWRDEKYWEFHSFHNYESYRWNRKNDYLFAPSLFKIVEAPAPHPGTDTTPAPKGDG